MMPTNPPAWLRSALALGAVLLVAGPGLLLADGSCPDYLTPASARIIGPGEVKVGGQATYALEVTFKDATKAINPSTTTWNTESLGGTGHITQSGDYAADTQGRVLVLAKFENSCGTATGNRKIRNVP